MGQKFAKKGGVNLYGESTKGEIEEEPTVVAKFPKENGIKRKKSLGGSALSKQSGGKVLGH